MSRHWIPIWPRPSAPSLDSFADPSTAPFPALRCHPLRYSPRSAPFPPPLVFSWFRGNQSDGLSPDSWCIRKGTGPPIHQNPPDRGAKRATKLGQVPLYTSGPGRRGQVPVYTSGPGAQWPDWGQLSPFGERCLNTGRFGPLGLAGLRFHRCFMFAHKGARPIRRHTQRWVWKWCRSCLEFRCRVFLYSQQFKLGAWLDG